MAAKRARSERIDESLSEDIDTGSCTQDSDFFLGDGNVILLAESTLFCIHKSMLSMHSKVFEDMFRVSSGSDRSQELLGGVPVVRMSDPASDLKHVINALYNRSYFRKNVEFEVAEALMSMSSKYMIDELRLEVVEYLRSLFPDNFEAFKLRYSSVPNKTDPEAIVGAITLGREYQVMDILPSAFLLSFGFSLEMIWDGVASKTNESKIYQLSTQDLRTYHLARERIFSPAYNVLAFLSTMPPPVCMTTVDSCRRALQEMADCSFHRDYIHTIEIIYAEKYLDPTLLTIIEHTCPTCREWWTDCLTNARSNVWHRLPDILDLPDWNQLRSYIPT